MFFNGIPNLFQIGNIIANRDAFGPVKWPHIPRPLYDHTDRSFDQTTPTLWPAIPSADSLLCLTAGHVHSGLKASFGVLQMLDIG